MGSGGTRRGRQWGHRPTPKPAAHSHPVPVAARRQTSRRYSLCLVRCLCSAFSRMPRGCSARATASSCSGSCSHHHPLRISARRHRGRIGPMELPTSPMAPPRTPGCALTGGNRLLRQLRQVLLLHLLKELGGGPPPALGLPRGVLQLLRAAPAAGAGRGGPGTSRDRGGGEQRGGGVICWEPIQL